MTTDQDIKQSEEKVVGEITEEKEVATKAPTGKSNSPFEIGLCMAGAVSAGAYSAGVLDFLLEALEEWEDQRGQPGTPSHQVVIKAIGGASAGGMTGIIAASVLNSSLPPVEKLTGDILAAQKQNKLYHSWVDLSESEEQPDMFMQLLSTKDIRKEKVYSLFNSTFIDDVANSALTASGEKQQRPYVEPHIKFFTTLTNLEGFKFFTDFKGNMTFNDYYLSRHNDHATFILNKSNVDYDNDGWIPVDFFDGVNVDIARDAAMATGAFPIGLKSRTIERKREQVNDLKWNKDITTDFPICEPLYKARIADGGTINNEPFQLVKELLTESKLSSKEDEFGATTLMIDPFPSYAESFNVEKDTLLSIASSTLSGILGHLRSKASVLKKMDRAEFGQFQIAPKRRVNNRSKEGAKAIACGFLGGFGGFVNKEFRIHDYFLGRANCEHFLREHFTVAAETTNPIFTEGYKKADHERFRSTSGRLQIIPVFKTRQDEMYMPTFSSGTNWPNIQEKDIKKYKRPIRRRVSKITLNLVRLSPFFKFLLVLGDWVLLRWLLGGRAYKAIRSAMIEHELLPDPDKK